MCVCMYACADVCMCVHRRIGVITIDRYIDRQTDRWMD